MKFVANKGKKVEIKVENENMAKSALRVLGK